MKLRQRIIALVLSVVMLLGILPATALAAADNLENFSKSKSFDSSTFTDVSADHWFYSNVKTAYQYGLMVGDSETTFRPNANVTLAETIAVAARLHAIYHTGEERFEQGTPWYQVYADYAVTNGIIPDDGIAFADAATRAEYAVILAAAFPDEALQKINEVSDNAIPDVSMDDSYAEAVYRLYRAGILTGNDAEGTFAPASAIRRSEVAAIVSRMADPTLRVQIDLSVSSSQPVPPAEDQPQTAGYAVTFEVGDVPLEERPEVQYVPDGQRVTEPNVLAPENMTLIGWYCGEGYAAPYDFAAPVHGDLTLYAKWAFEDDTDDTDGDGLTDQIEETFGADPDKEDTDDDGVSDYMELNWLNYDPRVDDTDGNGILDKDEDPDQDGLTNEEESKLGTIPISADSDSDYLSDYEEVREYHTDPLNSDTDGDGVDDGTEIEIGSDPLSAEASFQTSAQAGSLDENTNVTASAVVKTDAAGAGTLEIEELAPLDNPLVSPTIAGYLGSAFNFTADGSFEEAEITFRYDTALGTIGEDFQPRIYYLNEETGLLEELPDQVVTDGEIKVSVPHFSTYLLLNKVEFDQIWEKEINAPIESETGSSNIDVAFVVDCSGSMGGSRMRTVKTALHTFIGALQEKDRAALISFTKQSSLLCDLSADKAAVDSMVDTLPASGLTAMYTGLGTALDVLTHGDETYGYKMIIVLTDGYDEPETTYDGYYAPLVQRAMDNKVTIYSIGAGVSHSIDILETIAGQTGGAYYEATVTDGITDAFEQIQKETVDVVTDSNNDGLSDYYTKLLDDGTLTLSSGSAELVDVIGMFGEDCADWDGDGLLNGQEIKVCNDGSKIYVKMTSNPLLVDSDCDGYSDAEEQKMGTPPMKFTSDHLSSLEQLEDDSGYLYTDIATETGFVQGFNSFFDWQKTDEAKEQLIDYFYDYASEETITKNQKTITKLKAQETYLKWAQSLANIAKTAKNTCTIADDVSGMVEGMDDSGHAKEFIDYARTKKGKIKGASAQIRSARVRILKAMNTEEFSDQDLLKTILSDAESAEKAIDEFGDLLNEFDPASFAEDLTGKWAVATSGIASAVSTVKTVRDGMKYMKLNNGFKAISKGYKDFLKTKGYKSTGTYVSAALEGASGVLECWETANTYGKMKANRDAYLMYIDLLHYMAEHANSKYKYVRVAAGDIAEIIQDESWSLYEKQLFLANGKTVLLTTLSIAADFCPYTKVAKAAYDVAKMVISITGLANNARLYAACRTMKGVSDGCNHFLDTRLEHNGSYFSYGADESIYLIQLAQCRLVGEEYAKERLKKNDLAALVGRWINQTGKQDIEECYKTIAGWIYSNAENLKLPLSRNLPYYDTFYKDVIGAGGSEPGAFGSGGSMGGR